MLQVLSMSYGPSSPIHVVRVIRMREHASILLLWWSLSYWWLLRSHSLYLICQKLLLLLLSPFFFRDALTSATVVNKKGQRSSEREDDKRFKDVRVDVVIAIVGVTTRHGIVVIWLSRFGIPGGQFGFEKGGYPFLYRPFLSGDCEQL